MVIFTGVVNTSWRIKRIPEISIVKRIHNWKPFTGRPAGRPKSWWEDEVRNDLKKMRLTKWAEQVQDRLKWKDIVEKAKTIRVVAPQKKKNWILATSFQRRVIPEDMLIPRIASCSYSHVCSFRWYFSLQCIFSALRLDSSCPNIYTQFRLELYLPELNSVVSRQCLYPVRPFFSHPSMTAHPVYCTALLVFKCFRLVLNDDCPNHIFRFFKAHVGC